MEKHEFTKEELDNMSALELLRYGFQQLDEKTEQDIKEQMKNTTDNNELKQLQNKLEDVEKFKTQDNQQKPETQAEVMAKRMELRQKNDELKQQIKRYVVDGQTGQLVEVKKNIETNGHKK